MCHCIYLKMAKIFSVIRIRQLETSMKTKYELSIGVRMSRYGPLLHMNMHSYYIVTITSEIL